jgi:hypothetical protein
MSLAKAVPDGLKDRRCKKISLCKLPSIPYFLKKDCVQETVSAYKDNHHKMKIGKGTELRVPIWHSSMFEAFFIHVGSVLEAVKRKGYFKAYKEANEAYVEHFSRVEQAKAQLAKLDDSTNGEAGPPKKSTKKSNVTTAEASQADPALQAELVSEIKQAQEATDKAKAKGQQASGDMFQLYTNLLSVNAKYAWNKIIHERTASDPYTDLQGCSKKGPRGLLHKLFDNCVMFHLLTLFPNKVAKQEQYYIIIVLTTDLEIGRSKQIG